MSIYCTYITMYLGNKFPPFYIGSSSVNKIQKGYRGSVSSKKYKFLWKEEIENNPNLFITVIINTQSDRKESIKEELEIQKIFDVVNSPLFVNLSFAQPNGFFGMDVSGENNPRFGKSWGENHPRGMLGKTHTEENIKKFLERTKNIPKMQGKKHSEKTKSEMSKNRKGSKNSMFGKTHSEEARKKMSESRKGTIPWNKGKSSINS
jgi:hypothetical protein